jgi:hypothetical protein
LLTPPYEELEGTYMMMLLLLLLLLLWWWWRCLLVIESGPGREVN